MIDYCNFYHCPGDCGLPHNQQEMAEHMNNKPTRGRPVKPAADIAKTRTIRLTDADYAELMSRGMDRLRKWLRRPTKTKAAGEISRTSRPE